MDKTHQGSISYRLSNLIYFLNSCLVERPAVSKPPPKQLPNASNACTPTIDKIKHSNQLALVELDVKKPE